MPEMVTIAKDELEEIKARAGKCAMDKTYLQLVIRLMNRVSAAFGLEDTIDSMLHNSLDIMGGSNIILYFWDDSALFYVDVFGKKMQMTSIEDTVVQKVIATRKAVEIDRPLIDSRMTVPEFTKTFTWVYPLQVGSELVGVLKMESLTTEMRELYSHLPTFFIFAALVLKNAVMSHSKLKIEEKTRQLNEELEQRVVSRTHELEENQMALMNIVEDLNESSRELEEANQKLKELDRLKSMFIASMSHELRTPLNSIIGFSSVLHNEWIGPVNAEQKENLAIILRSGKLLLNLINDVIDVSKIEAGKIESEIEEFNLRDLIGEAANLNIKPAQDKGLELKCTSESLIIRTDRRRLLQCVLNLMSNAVKYTMKGWVVVNARLVKEQTVRQASGFQGEFIEISVEDTGLGISEEDRPKIFQPFVRIINPSQAVVPGTGLGLYLSKKLTVEVLKGDLFFTSEYDKGSTFILRIPERLP